MAATLYGTTGLSFGVTAETGGLLQSIEIKKSVEKATVRDADGDTVGKALYDPSEEISLEFVFTTTGAGLGAATLAGALSLSSYTPTSGSMHVEEITDKRENTGYRTISMKLSNNPLI